MQQILISEFGELKSETHFLSLHVIQTGSKNGRSPNAPPYDQKSTDGNEEQQEFARHRAYKLHKGASSRRKNTKDVSNDETRQNQKDNDQFLQYFPKKNCIWSAVALRYIYGIISCWITKRRIPFNSQAKFWIFRPPMASWSQTRKQRSTSRSLALTYGCIWWKVLRQWYHWEDCNELGFFFFVADRGNSQIIKRRESDQMYHRQLRHHGCSYHTEGSTIHWILDSLGKPWARTRSGGHHVGSVTTIYTRITRTRCIFPNSDTSFPNQKDTTMCPFIIRKTPNVRFVRRPKQHEPGVE